VPATATRTPPTSPRLRAKYERRRERVVAAAAHVFATRGYHNTSIDDLVTASGLQRGGLYHYIESKQQLLLLIQDQLLQPLLQQAREIAARDGDPEEQLRALMRIWVLHISAHRDHMTVFNEERRLIESVPEWTRVRQQRREFQTILGDVLRRGVEDGSFLIADADVALMSILGIVNYMPQWFDSAGRLSPEEVADRCVDLVLRGIAREQKGVSHP
jgi:TetR/AcrR family transcriptional regulator, cholesterol catabolism regulator